MLSHLMLWNLLTTLSEDFYKHSVAFAHTLVPTVENALSPCWSVHMTISYHFKKSVPYIHSVEASLYSTMIKIYYLLSEKWVQCSLASFRTKNRLEVLGQ